MSAFSQAFTEMFAHLGCPSMYTVFLERCIWKPVCRALFVCSFMLPFMTKDPPGVPLHIDGVLGALHLEACGDAGLIPPGAALHWVKAPGPAMHAG
jgi:hypothetical protein